MKETFRFNWFLAIPITFGIIAIAKNFVPWFYGNGYEKIIDLGINVHMNTELGRDISLDELREQYDAVFIATGAWKSSSLRCENDNAEGVIGGIDMLYKVENGEKIDLGKNVAVVGGGNTAIDAVRTAVRLGAENVTLIYRRTESEMPAEKDEIKDAKDEGVNFKFLVAPLNVVTENGKVKGINLQKMELGEPDASGRRSPVRVEGETEILYCDTIISAIGQQVVSEDIKELELTKKGTISADESSFKTSVDGVFAAGDVINKGPDIAVRAIAGGKNAARSIDCYLNGVQLTPELPQYAENKDFDATLMVKDFNSKGILKFNDDFMTNADTPYITTKDIIKDAKNPFTIAKNSSIANIFITSLAAIYSVPHIISIISSPITNNPIDIGILIINIKFKASFIVL